MRTAIKALFVSLVLGTSALASAAPCEPTPAPAPVYHANPLTWTNLTSGLSLAGKRVFTIGEQRGRFTTLELSAGRDNGYTRVTGVTVYFTNGSTQVIPMNAKIDHANNNLQLDLDGTSRTIARVAITGTSYGRGQVEIRGLKIA